MERPCVECSGKRRVKVRKELTSGKQVTKHGPRATGYQSISNLLAIRDAVFARDGITIARSLPSERSRYSGWITCQKSLPVCSIYSSRPLTSNVSISLTYNNLTRMASQEHKNMKKKF